MQNLISFFSHIHLNQRLLWSLVSTVTYSGSHGFLALKIGDHIPCHVIRGIYFHVQSESEEECNLHTHGMGSSPLSFDSSYMDASFPFNNKMEAVFSLV